MTLVERNSLAASWKSWAQVIVDFVFPCRYICFPVLDKDMGEQKSFLGCSSKIILCLLEGMRWADTWASSSCACTLTMTLFLFSVPNSQFCWPTSVFCWLRIVAGLCIGGIGREHVCYKNPSIVALYVQQKRQKNQVSLTLDLSRPGVRKLVFELREGQLLLEWWTEPVPCSVRCHVFGKITICKQMRAEHYFTKLLSASLLYLPSVDRSSGARICPCSDFHHFWGILSVHCRWQYVDIWIIIYSLLLSELKKQQQQKQKSLLLLKNENWGCLWSLDMPLV